MDPTSLKQGKTYAYICVNPYMQADFKINRTKQLRAAFVATGKILIRPSLNSYFPALSYHIHSDCFRSHLSMEDPKFTRAVEKEWKQSKEQRSSERKEPIPSVMVLVQTMCLLHSVLNRNIQKFFWDLELSSSTATPCSLFYLSFLLQILFFPHSSNRSKNEPKVFIIIHLLYKEV